MSDDWDEADTVIACEVFAVELVDPDGVGVLVELVTDEGAYRMVWRRDQADHLLDELIDAIGVLEDHDTEDD